MSDLSAVPTRRCRIIDPDRAVAEIHAFLERLRRDGERAWCEVWYPAPIDLSEDARTEWESRQADTFDAVELIDGELVTLPPYDELEEGA